MAEQRPWPRSGQQVPTQAADGQHPRTGHDEQIRPDQHEARGTHAGHGGHRWMMLACCVPMIAIALVLVVTGVAGAGVIFAAVLCTLMMALMMRGMGDGGHGEDRR